MKQLKDDPKKKSNSNNKFNLPTKFKGYPVKRVAFHRKVGKNR